MAPGAGDPRGTALDLSLHVSSGDPRGDPEGIRGDPWPEQGIQPV